MPIPLNQTFEGVLKMEQFFYRVPNDWIRSKPPNIKKICTCYLIDETRGLGGRGITSIQYIIDNCGYKSHRGQDRVNKTYETILQDLFDSDVLSLSKGYQFPPQNISTAIPYIVNENKFDTVDNFTKLSDREFDAIIRYNSNRNKENLLALYLYVKSFYHQSTTGNRPIGFYQSLETVKERIGLSRYTAIGIYDELVKKKLLYKYYVGSREINKSGGTVRENVPNIYIPNLGQDVVELEDTYKSTVDIMKDFYGVAEFLPFMKNLKEI